MNKIRWLEMLDGIEALLALDKYETVSLSAVRLRLTQSAVSKRIMTLEDELGQKLTEPKGRKIVLTAFAHEFLRKAKPLYEELKGLKESMGKSKEDQSFDFSLGLSDSIAGSFGPLVVKDAQKQFKKLQLRFHVHRSLMLLENISLGKYQMGICTYNDERKELVSFKLGDEPLVLIAPNLEKFSHKIQMKSFPLIMIEENSATWKASGEMLKKEHPNLFVNDLLPVESFLAVYQMCKVGIGFGILPKAMARELGLKNNEYRKLKVTRPVSLVTRKTITELAFFHPFYMHLKNQVTKILNE